MSRGYIGINIGEVDDAIAKSLGMDRPRGIIIQGILENGSASEADLRPGDVILEIDGREVDAPNQLQSYVAAQTAGTTVTLKIFRDGEELERKVTLKKKDDDSKTEPASDNSKENTERKSNVSSATFDNIGLTVKNLNDRDRTDFNVDHGVLITEVKPFGKADDQRLFAGLVIVEADRKKVDDVNGFSEIVKGKKGEALLLNVIDNKGNSRFVGLEIPE